MSVISFGEIVDRAADAFGEQHGHVVGRFHHHHLERVVDGDLRADREAHLGRRLQIALRETVNSVSKVMRSSLTALNVM